ncbi:methyl viologen resistance protein SmvA [Thermoplasmatales archaeon]|nr:methyl viologen resistance protein SmvA [Thermoplasmatales archaeon]
MNGNKVPAEIYREFRYPADVYAGVSLVKKNLFPTYSYLSMDDGSVKRKFILLTTSMAAFLSPFLSSAIAFAVPKIGVSFHLTFYQVAILPMIFLIPLASFMIFFGRLSDDIGRVKIFRAGLLIFAASALLVPAIHNYQYVVMMIFFTGLGSAVLSTNSTAIVSYVYSSGGRGFALGINAMAVYLGLTFAPFLGGLLIELSGWESIFFLSGPLAICALLISIPSMKSLEIKAKTEKTNLRQVSMFSTFLVLLTTYAAFGDIFGYLKLAFLPILSLFFLLIFLHYEKNSTNPVIPPSVFRNNRTFIASNVTAFLNYVSTFSIVFVFSIYLQVILHVNPFLSGIIILPEPVLMVLLSPVSGKLADRFGSRLIASSGMVIIGVSFLLLFLESTVSRLDITALLGFIGVGFGLFSAPNTNSVMGSVRREDSSIASGFLGTMRFTGQMMSIVAATLILSLFLPASLITGMFSGTVVTITPFFYGSFVSGFRIVMLVSAILAIIGAMTSLMKSRGK